MFGLNGFSPVSLLATTALGPMGGIAAQLASQVFSSMGQQLIQQLGSQMGLPQSSIDFAQTAFSAGSSGFAPGNVGASVDDSVAALGNFFGSSPSDIGQAQRDAQDGISSILNDLAQSDDVREARSGGKGGSWLRAMAEVLGKKLDDLAHEMQDLAGKVNKEDPSTSTDFTVVSQEFNMLMNAVTNALKTIGEAMGKSAARQ